MDGEVLTLSEIDFTEELSDNNNLNEVKLPYVIKDHIIMSPGIWNEFSYSKDVIAKALSETEWNERNRSLFWEHSEDARDWVGDIKNLRIKDGNLLADIYIVDKPLAIKLAYGAKFGVSPKVLGDANNKRKVHNATFANFSIVLNPAVKTTFLNSEIKMEETKMTDEKSQSVENNKTSFEIDYNLLAEKVAEKLSAKKKEETTKANPPQEMSEVEKLKAELAEANKKISELSEAIKKASEPKTELSEKKEEVKHQDAVTDKMAESNPGVEGSFKAEMAPQQSGDSQPIIAQMREMMGKSSEAVEMNGLPSDADLKMANWLRGLI